MTDIRTPIARDLTDNDVVRISDRGNPQLDLIGMVYRLYGNLRTQFAGSNDAAGLILLEAHALGVIAINYEGVTVSQIGRELGYSRQAMQRAINKLERSGLVEARPNPRHKRAPVFFITAVGREHLAITQASAQDLALHLGSIFDDARAEALMRELIAMLDIVQAHRAA